MRSKRRRPQGYHAEQRKNGGAMADRIATRLATPDDTEGIRTACRKSAALPAPFADVTFL